MISLGEIEKLAALSRIQLDDEEKKKLQRDVGAILEYVKQIQDISVTHAPQEQTGIKNVMREDAEPHTGALYTEVLLGAAPEREGQYLKVKKIL